MEIGPTTLLLGLEGPIHGSIGSRRADKCDGADAARSTCTYGARIHVSEGMPFTEMGACWEDAAATPRHLLLYNYMMRILQKFVHMRKTLHTVTLYVLLIRTVGPMYPVATTLVISRRSNRA